MITHFFNKPTVNKYEGLVGTNHHVTLALPPVRARSSGKTFCVVII